jgi:hypothetical protein
MELASTGGPIIDHSNMQYCVNNLKMCNNNTLEIITTNRNDDHDEIKEE